MEGEHSDAFIDTRFDPDSMEEDDRKWWKNQLEAYSYHSDMMVKLMADHLCWIFHQKDLFSYLYKKEYIYQVKEGNGEQAGKKKRNSDSIWKAGCGIFRVHSLEPLRTELLFSNGKLDVFVKRKLCRSWSCNDFEVIGEGISGSNFV